MTRAPQAVGEDEALIMSSSSGSRDCDFHLGKMRIQWRGNESAGEGEVLISATIVSLVSLVFVLERCESSRERVGWGG